jgi:hypothetical protein
MLLLGAIFLPPTSSNRQVPPFALIAVFLFGPLIQERLAGGVPAWRVKAQEGHS